jgi:hypothetical protein
VTPAHLLDTHTDPQDLSFDEEDWSHGLTSPRFHYTDTLFKALNEERAYDLVLANPPFKGAIDAADVNPSLPAKCKKTEILFVHLFLRLLENGRGDAVIVSDSVISILSDMFRPCAGVPPASSGSVPAPRQLGGAVKLKHEAETLRQLAGADACATSADAARAAHEEAVATGEVTAVQQILAAPSGQELIPTMSKAEILAELPKLKAEERTQVFDRL